MTGGSADTSGARGRSVDASRPLHRPSDAELSASVPDEPRTHRRLRRWATLLGAFVVPLAGLAELAGQAYVTHSAPRFDEWSALSEPLAAMRHDGDLVVIAPRWAEPLARHAVGDEQLPMADLARADARRYAEAVEISILGQRAPELEGWSELARSSSGPFLLRRLANPSPTPASFDFIDAFSPGRVSVTTGERATACSWSDHAPIRVGGLGGHPTFGPERFQCAGGPFMNVGPTIIADQDFLPRRCLWAHPPARGELVIRYSDVPLGEVIEGHGGLYWIIERERAGAPIHLSVRVDGETLGQMDHRDGDGWKAFAIPLGAHAHRSSAAVEFAVSASNNLHRHFCFEAVTR